MSFSRKIHDVLINSYVRCKQMFYVSETDMLKAVHSALLDEVISSGGDELDATRMQNLRNFLDLLIQRFPRKTFERSKPPTHPKALSVGKVKNCEKYIVIS